MSYMHLKAYQAAQLLRAEFDKLLKVVDARFEYLATHVDEAIDSILNNLSEGAESIYPGRRRSFYDIAANSSREARNGLRSLAERGAFNGMSAFRAIGLAMTTSKLIRSLIESLPE